MISWMDENRSREKKWKTEVKPEAGIGKKIKKPRVTIRSASRATCRRSELPVKRPLADAKICDRLTVPVDADPGRLGRHSLSVHDLDLSMRDLPELRNVLQVDGVRHRCGKTDMKLHEKVRRDFDVEGLGEVSDLEPWRDATKTGGVGLEDSGGAGCRVFAELAQRVDALAHRDRDVRRGGQPDVAREILGRKRFLQPVEVEVFEKMRSPLGLRVGHRLVGVDHDVERRPDCLAHGAQPLEVLLRPRLADFELDPGPALFL